MYRVSWVNKDGHPREEIFTTKEEKNDWVKRLEELGIVYSWEWKEE